MVEEEKEEKEEFDIEISDPNQNIELGKANIKFKAPRGMRDILPLAISNWRFVESVIIRDLEMAGFEEVRLPAPSGTGGIVYSLRRRRKRYR